MSYKKRLVVRQFFRGLRKKQLAKTTLLKMCSEELADLDIEEEIKNIQKREAKEAEVFNEQEGSARINTTMESRTQTRTPDIVDRSYYANKNQRYKSHNFNHDNSRGRDSSHQRWRERNPRSDTQPTN